MRIVEKVDTRDVEEIGDRFVRISGTGVVHSCDRCGRDHEVYYVVEHGDRVYTLGSTCAKKASPEMAIQVKAWEQVERAQATLQRLEADLAAAQAQEAAYRVVAAEVDTLPVPEIVEVWAPHKYTNDPNPTVYLWLHCGDEGRARCIDGRRDREREQCAVSGWRQARIQERGGERPAGYVVQDLQRRIQRQAQKVAALQEARGE